MLIYLNRQSGFGAALTVDVRAKVNFADIVVLKHCGVAGVGSVVSSTVVERATRGEGQSSIETIFLNQLPGAVLQLLTARTTKQQ